MTETFLHYLFDNRKLGNSFQTTEDELIEVIDFGELNKSSGPDFLQARIKYEDKLWAGHIEFHLKSSDWNKHGHQNDKAYGNVIAHFVLNHDTDIYINKFKLPVVELSTKIEAAEFEKYKKLENSGNRIPCEKMIPDTENGILEEQKRAALFKRLGRKSSEILNLIRKNNGNQQRAFLLLLAKAFGGKLNQDGFSTLVEKVELSTLAHLNFDPFRIQSMLHGLSGLLPDEVGNDPYITAMQKEFTYQKSLYQLLPMSGTEWKFYGMRPSSHPTFRIAQLAGLLTNCSKSLMSADSNSPDWESKLTLELDEFWSSHNNFNNQILIRKSQISRQFKNHILINVTIPFAFAIGELKGNSSHKGAAIEHLTEIQAESNSIVSKWNEIGVIASNAYDSQALIELKNEFCNQKKCLICSIGKNALNL